MDSETLKFRSIPVGSLSMIPDGKSSVYFESIFRLQPRVQAMLYSITTGAYIRGVTRTYDIPIEQAPHLAFIVLQIAIGETSLAKLAVILSANLKIANDKAQAVAQEIERELFSPIMLELHESLKNQTTTAGQPEDIGTKNILNLKQQPRKSRS